MPDLLDRLKTALADRYAIERALEEIDRARRSALGATLPCGGVLSFVSHCLVEDRDRILNHEQGISKDDVVLMQLRNSSFKIRYS